MTEVVGALVELEALEQHADGCPQSTDGAGGRLARQRFELGEELLDRVQVGGVRRQIDNLGALRLDGLADSVDLVRREVIHNHDVARPKGQRQHLLDIGP